MDGTPSPIWADPRIVRWTQWLLDSFRLWTGRDLIPLDEHSIEQAKRLFESPQVVVSHGLEADPLLNYGNQAALNLWEMRWDEFVGMPSRLTAEPPDREERDRMLRRVARYGFVNDYRGVRISKSGKRFFVERALVWNVLDAGGQLRGQAAAFSQWTVLS